MESLELANRITDIIVDRQGEDVLILDLQKVATFTDYFVLCSGTSRRQLSALQSAIREELKQDDVRLVAHKVEGEAETGWVLLDYNGVIVHLFSPDMRAFYDLEGLWNTARVVVQIQ